MRRIIATVFLATGMAALFLITGAARIQAASTTIHCTVQSIAECQITDSDGIQAVRVTVETAQGPALVVDESFSCITSTGVSWEPIVPGYAIEVDDCDGQTEGGTGFGGLLHLVLGEAQMQRDGPTLMVSGFDADGDDGVAILADGAATWSGLLLPLEPVADGGFEAAAFAGNTAPDTAIMFSKHMTDVIVFPSPQFAGDPYQVQLFSGSDLVYEQDGIPGGSGIIGLPGWFCDSGADVLDCAPRLAVGIEAASGLWFWELTFPKPMGMQTPGGRAEADRLRFDQEGEAGESAPRALHRIELRGRNLPFLTIFDETVSAGPAANSLALPVILNGESNDPFGLEELTRFLEAAQPPSDSLRINDSLTVEVIGPGNLIETEVEEEEPGGEPRGERDPDEPPADGIPAQRQTLRMFNTANKMEYEIVVEGALLQSIHRLRAMQGATGAWPGAAGIGGDGLVGWLPPRAPGQIGAGILEPAGWSDGVDNRTLLTGTTWWPWRSIVHFSNNCSGVLVGPRHILTAAHCINQRGTNNWYSFTVSPGRNGSSKPYGDSEMDPNPQPGDPFRWYFTPSQWRSAQYNNTNCAGNCYAATEWDWGLIIIPEHLGYQTGWMGYVARPAGQLNLQSHFNRGYPWCDTDKGNAPANCQPESLYGDTQLCTMGEYLFQGGDNWNRVIRNSCDISGGHSGSPIYHYFYDSQLGKTVPVAAMVAVWEHCYTCSSGNPTPTSARRLTPSDLGVISFFRQWKP